MFNCPDCNSTFSSHERMYRHVQVCNVASDTYSVSSSVSRAKKPSKSLKIEKLESENLNLFSQNKELRNLLEIQKLENARVKQLALEEFDRSYKDLIYKLDMLESANSVFEQTHRENLVKNQELTEKIVSLENLNAKITNTLESSYNESLVAQKTRFESELESLKLKSMDELITQKRELESIISNQESIFNNEKKNLVLKYTDELESLKKTHSESIDLYIKKLDSLQKEYDRKLAEFQIEREAHTNQLLQKNKNIEELQKFNENQVKKHDLSVSDLNSKFAKLSSDLRNEIELLKLKLRDSELQCENLKLENRNLANSNSVLAQTFEDSKRDFSDKLLAYKAEENERVFIRRSELEGEYSKKFEKLTLENEYMRNKLVDLDSANKTVDQLNSTLKSYETVFIEKSNKLDEVMKSNSANLLRISHLEKEISQYTVSINNLKKIESDLREELSSAKADALNSDKLREESVKMYKLKEDEIVKSSTKINLQISKNNLIISDLKFENNKLKNEVRKQLEMIIGLDQLKELNKSLAEKYKISQENCSKLNSKLEFENNKYLELQASFDKWKETHSRMVKERNIAIELSHRLRGTLEKSNSDSACKNLEIAKLEENLLDYSVQFNALNEKLLNFEEIMAKKQTELELSNNRIMKLEQLLSDSESQKSKLKPAMDNMRESYERVSKSYEELRVNYQSQVDQNILTEKKLSELQNRYNRIEKESKSERDKSLMIINNLREELVFVKEQNHKLQYSDIVRLENRISTLEKK